MSKLRKRIEFTIVFGIIVAIVIVAYNAYASIAMEYEFSHSVCDSLVDSIQVETPDTTYGVVDSLTISEIKELFR